MSFDSERFDEVEIDFNNKEMKGYCNGKKGFLKQMDSLKGMNHNG